MPTREKCFYAWVYVCKDECAWGWVCSTVWYDDQIASLLLLTKNLYLKGYKLWNVSIKDDQKFTTKDIGKEKKTKNDKEMWEMQRFFTNI